MIKLAFLHGREVMNFRIEDRCIYYSDRIWKSEIRCIPKDEQFIKKVRESRNKFPMKLITMFNLSEKAQQEYDNAKTDEELAEIVILDCKKKGLKLIDKKVGENGRDNK